MIEAFLFIKYIVSVAIVVITVSVSVCYCVNTVPSVNSYSVIPSGGKLE